MNFIITHVRKDKKGRITHVKTLTKELPKQEVIRLVEKEGADFYVLSGSIKIEVKVIQRGRTKYLRTVKDEIDTNNLDELELF